MRRTGLLGLWLVVAVTIVAEGQGWGQEAAGEPAVKVHKDRVTVYPPDGRGMVRVEGLSGAVTTTSEAAVTVVNLETGMEGAVQLSLGGSFAGEVAARAGEKVRVLARNAEGKRSYGTFDVPVRAATATVVSASLAAPESSGEGDREALRQRGRRQLAVLVMVVDLGTGELVATERMVGAPRSRHGGEDATRVAAQNVVRRCVQAVQGELRMTDSYGSVAEPEVWVRPAAETSAAVEAGEEAEGKEATKVAEDGAGGER